MPGYTERKGYARCLECDGPDIVGVGFFMHMPTCSTQPGYEQAREKRAREIADRRREIDELVASPEGKRLRSLRSIKRLA